MQQVPESSTSSSSFRVSLQSLAIFMTTKCHVKNKTHLNLHKKDKGMNKLRLACLMVGKTGNYSPNGSLMVIYHGRIRKKNHKQKKQTQGFHHQHHTLRKPSEGQNPPLTKLQFPEKNPCHSGEESSPP